MKDRSLRLNSNKLDKNYWNSYLNYFYNKIKIFREVKLFIQTNLALTSKKNCLKFLLNKYEIKHKIVL